MIQVVSHGIFHEDPLPPKTYKCKCWFCSCIFSFDTNDAIFDYQLTDMSGNHPLTIECPECGRMNRSHYWRLLED